MLCKQHFVQICRVTRGGEGPIDAPTGAEINPGSIFYLLPCNPALRYSNISCRDLTFCPLSMNESDRRRISSAGDLVTAERKPHNQKHLLAVGVKDKLPGAEPNQEISQVMCVRNTS